MAGISRGVIILTTRNPYPERKYWDHIQQTGDAKTIKQIQSILRIEKLGGKIEIFQSDTSDEISMELLARDVTAGYSSIDGVLHLAGIPGGDMIAFKDREESDSILDVKIKGALVLQKIFRKLPPDFILYFSSFSVAIQRAQDYGFAYIAWNCLY